jgi:CRP-like cAMP-binding protein
MAFGEMALINKENKRQATIITTEPTTYLTLDRITYQRSLSKIDLRKINAKVEFLMQIPCFKDQQKKNVAKFTHYLQKHSYIRNQYVYKEGDPADFVYIVYSGEFELGKKLPKPDSGS